MSSGSAVLLPRETSWRPSPATRPTLRPAALAPVPARGPAPLPAVFGAGAVTADPPSDLRSDEHLMQCLDIIELPADTELSAAAVGPDCELAMVVSGGLTRRHTVPDGREVSSLALAGDLLLTSLEPSADTDSLGRTWRPSQVGTLSRTATEALLAERPELGVLLFRAALKQQARTRQQYLDLVFRDVPGRVAKLLLLLHGLTPDAERRAGRVDHGLTQTEIARIVAASRETVNKALGDFARRGWIMLEERSFLVIDPAALQRRCR